MFREIGAKNKTVNKPSLECISNVIQFECAEIKTEPLDGLDPEPDIIFPQVCNRNSNNVGIQTAKRKVTSRGVQVDLQPVPKEVWINSQVGTITDEPLAPDVTNGAIEKQCRICLRRLPETSLSYILFPQKTKILTALGIKVYLGDAYPFICRNCTSLVDLIYDFRNTCMMARNMLVHERKSITNNGWDRTENLELIDRCKVLIDSHKRDIETAYETTSFFKQSLPQEEVKIKPEAIELVMVDQIPVSETKLVDVIDSQPENDSSNHSPVAQLMADTNYSKSDSENSSAENDDQNQDDYDSSSRDEDYAPSPMPVPKTFKKKRIRIVTKPYKRRQRKEKDSSGDDQLALQDAEGRLKKKRKNAADPNRKRGALCDFCGEWVEYHTVESHKNQHLGVKPYACQTEGCKLSFSCRNLLIKHIKRQHGADGPEYHDCEVCGQRIKGPKAALKKHQKTHTEEKNFICAVCGKGFTTQGYLRQHSIIHTDLMPFECSVCHRKFNNKYNMLTHEKKHFLRGEPSSANNASIVEDVSTVLPPFGVYPTNQPPLSLQQEQHQSIHLSAQQPLLHPQ
ncbi:zinc finger protein 28 homolog [Toxorhynchites rutilus septentrionalis]|uniref:zinc finger protein 28 homolog n=1 Tax=Toxorhynchites rutilus septentrionalis TaxID=329112 RepID=UPI002479A171|nr:zinc finger protein 28 homolog [Toxorhynchites rutilus septentrionalis]